MDQEKKDNIIIYGATSAIEWAFKKSPVGYFIGCVASIATMALSGGLELRAKEGSLVLTYSNSVTVLSAVISVLCLVMMYGAVYMQMKERAIKLKSGHDKELKKLASDQEVKLLNVKNEHKKQVEKLKAELELEKDKANNKHINIGDSCNNLLNKIVRLQPIFAQCHGRGSVGDDCRMIDGKPLDIYITDAYTSQDSIALLYRDDKELYKSWQRLISLLQESQAAISRHFKGQVLDLTPIASTHHQLNDFIAMVHNSGHKLDFNSQ